MPELPDPGRKEALHDASFVGDAYPTPAKLSSDRARGGARDARAGAACPERPWASARDAAWNVVAIARDGLTGASLRALATLGTFRTTGYPRVLVGRVQSTEPPADILSHEGLLHALAGGGGLGALLSRMLPLERCVRFRTDDVTETLCDELAPAAARLCGTRFHVRVRLRGRKGRLEHPAVERALGAFLLDRTVELGAPARVGFDDADVVVAVEVVEDRLGYVLADRALRALELVKLR